MILMKLEYSQQSFEKNIPIPRIMQIRPIWAKLFIADGWKDGQTKLIVAYQHSAKAPARHTRCTKFSVSQVFLL